MLAHVPCMLSVRGLRYNDFLKLPLQQQWTRHVPCRSEFFQAVVLFEFSSCSKANTGWTPWGEVAINNTSKRLPAWAGRQPGCA